MNISKRQTGDLNAIITIELNPADYQPKVEKTINKYRKTMNIPGFRPGHVPVGIIKKKYGKDVLVDEINNLLSSELYNYLRENKIDMLGTPVPVNTETIEIEDGKDFTFDYEIGIAPTINLKFPESKIPYYLVKIDDKMVEEDVNDMRRRYGKFSNPETAESTSVLYGEFAELDENGEVKADGNKTVTTLSIEMIKDEEQKNKFIGAKKDDVIRYNPMKAVMNETEASAMLRLEKNSPALYSDYNFTVKTINKIEKADLNQEFFDKIFGTDVIHNEEELHAKIREGIASYFEKESDKKLNKDLKNIFLKENNLSLPDDFLKRMLKSQKKESDQQNDLDHEYFHLAEDLKWSLIETKIATDNNIIVDPNEVIDSARMMITQQFAQYGMEPPDDQKLIEMTTAYLQKDDNLHRLERSIVSQKVFEHLKKNVALNITELQYSEFTELLKEKTEHEHEHHH